MTEQPTLFADDKHDDVSVEPADLADVARRIAEAAPANPYAAQEERQKAIVAARGEDLAREQTGRSVIVPDDAAERVTPDSVAKANIASIREQLANRASSQN